jgi:hypothetical protein
VKVDPFAPPFMERLEAEVEVDADYIVRIDLVSKGRGDHASLEIHNLEFALALPTAQSGGTANADERGSQSERGGVGSVQLRSNVTPRAAAWDLVPGDIVAKYKPGWFDVRGRATQGQIAERLYYEPCATCRRNSFECEWEGCDQPACTATLPNSSAARARRSAFEHRPGP